jgi:hypothetical protein
MQRLQRWEFKCRKVKGFLKQMRTITLFNVISPLRGEAYCSYEIIGMNHLEITINLASVVPSLLRTAELDECGNLQKQETAVQS